MLSVATEICPFIPCLHGESNPEMTQLSLYQSKEEEEEVEKIT